MSRYGDSADRNPGAFYEDAILGEQEFTTLASAMLAAAAELRTANLISFQLATAGPLANFSRETLRPIRERLGLES